MPNRDSISIEATKDVISTNYQFKGSHYVDDSSWKVLSKRLYTDVKLQVVSMILDTTRVSSHSDISENEEIFCFRKKTRNAPKEQ